MDPAYYDDLIRRVVAGRKLIVCADVLVGAYAQAKAMRALGALRPFLIAGTLGTGELPTEADTDWVLLPTAGDSVMQRIRSFEDALLAPSDELLAALDAYDPQREAMILGTIFMRDGDHLSRFRRRAYGTRPAAWEEIEDKVVVDELFDAAGVETAPRLLVPPDEASLRVAHERLNGELGTAMAGDAKEGWWGGAENLRWVRGDDDIGAAASFFSELCDRVRVMPFLEGIPCSVHGMVFDDTVIAFRPVEMLTLRRGGRSKLHYAGVATYWDPLPEDRETMWPAARRVGEVLRDRVDYRGLFTLDGVMTAEGFRPTEINPRVGAGLTPQTAACGVNLPFLSRMVSEREPVDFRPAELEAFVLERADARRGGACYTVYPEQRSQTERHAVVDDGGSFRPAGDGEASDGHIVLGPSGVGGFVSYSPDPQRIATGPSFAPTAVRAFAYTDERFGTGLGPLEPARTVR